MVSQWPSHRQHRAAPHGERREENQSNREGIDWRRPTNCASQSGTYVRPSSFSCGSAHQLFLQLPRYVSPRRRAQRTFELLEVGCREKHPWAEQGQIPQEEVRTNAKVQITEDIREWDYGDYEGVTSAEIREQRGKAGLEPWDIWRDGCPGGEYVHPYSSLPSRDMLSRRQEPRAGIRTHRQTDR
jgi:hypothetical protein